MKGNKIMHGGGADRRRQKKKKADYFKEMNRQREQQQQQQQQSQGPPRKRTLAETPMDERPQCKFYMEGKCNKGHDCPFNHDFQPPRKLEVCKFYLSDALH